MKRVSYAVYNPDQSCAIAALFCMPGRSLAKELTYCAQTQSALAETLKDAEAPEAINFRHSSRHPELKEPATRRSCLSRPPFIIIY